jgi:hypothetical protein
MKLETQNSYITNPQFVGGVPVIPTSGSTFGGHNANNPQFGFVAGGLYVGEIGTLVVKTYDQSVFTMVSELKKIYVLTSPNPISFKS